MSTKIFILIFNGVIRTKMKNVRCILTIFVVLVFGIYGQVIQSPCPAIFQYSIDRKTREYFGFVQLRNLKPGQVVKLLINLSLPAQLPTVRYLNYFES